MSEPRFKTCTSCKYRRDGFVCSHPEVAEHFTPTAKELVVGGSMTCMDARTRAEVCGSGARHWEWIPLLFREPLVPMEPVSREPLPPVKIEEVGSFFSPFWLGVGIAIGAIIMFLVMCLGGGRQ